MQTLKTILKKVISQDWYRTVLMIMIPISIGLLLYLLIVNPSSILVADWFFDLVIIPSFIGNMASAATYIGRFGDDWDDVKKGVRLLEKIGTILGLVAGLAYGITIAVLHVTVPYTTTLLGIANVIFTLNQIARFSGLGTRLGTLTSNHPRPSTEKWMIGASIVLGLSLSLTLYLLSATTLVTIGGVITLLTGGAALPAVLGGLIFVCSFTSLLASATDFASRGVCFIQAKFSNDQNLINTVNNRFHEYRGAFVGSVLGITLTATVVTALAIAQPHLFVGIAGFAIAGVVGMLCMSAMAGLSSRIGRLTDGFLATPAASITTAPAATNASTAVAQLALAPTSTLKKQSDAQEKRALPTSSATNDDTFGEQYPVFGFMAATLNPELAITTAPAARPVAVVS